MTTTGGRTARRVRVGWVSAGLLAAGIGGAATLGCESPAPFHIGVVVGNDGALGARLAAADVRAAGGVHGRDVELVVIPHEFATAAAPSITTADSLAADPLVIAVIGHSNSAASLAASQIYNARHLVHVAPTTTAPLFSQAGPYSYRLVPDDAKQAAFLARCLADAHPAHPARVALVYVNDDYGRGLQAAVRARLDTTRSRIVYEIPYLDTADTTDMRTIVAPLLASRPDVLLWLGRFPALLYLRRVGGDPVASLPTLASDGVDAAAVYQSRRYYVGVRFVRFVDPAAPDPRLQAFRQRFTRTNRLESSTEAVLSYDAAQLIIAALQSGAHTRDDVRRWLDALGHTAPAFPGISGPIAFDANGDVTRVPQLAEVRADGVSPVPIPCTPRVPTP